jgi:hypothetical protein
MYCLLTYSLGNNPQKSFQVIQGGSSFVSQHGAGTSNEGLQLKKDFDGVIKGNVFILDGQKMHIPPGGEKSAKLEIVHRYLVL